jgi:hypothetical protein
MAASSDVNTSGFAISAQSQICHDIFYQHVRGLRTKQLEFYDSVSSTGYNVICLTET